MDQPDNPGTLQELPDPDARAFEDAVFREDRAAIDDLTPPGDVGVLRGTADHSAVGLRMVEIALGQLGVCESGNNGGVPLTRYVRAFWPSSGPQPWCAFFVSWCYLKSTRRKPPWSNAGYVPSVESWASSTGRRVRIPLRGDMFGVGGTHMGIVTRSLQNKVYTIEGNTSSGCVKSIVRPTRGLWFARP